VGVYYHDASGSMTNDIVTGINLPPDLFGCQGGQGVYVTTDSGQADASSLTMNRDKVSSYDKNGITCDDPGTVCTITNTTVTGIGSTTQIAQNGIQIWAASGTLKSDKVTGNTYDGPSYAASGVLIGNPYTVSMNHNVVTDNDSNVYVIQDQTPAWVYCGNTGTACTNRAKTGTTFLFSQNTVSDATNVDGNSVGSGYGDGLDLDSVTETTDALGNTADHDPGIGIALYGSTSAVLQKDTAKSDGDGIYLGSGTASSTATDNLVTQNKVGSATVDGILADTASTGNTISGNTIHGDSSWDAQDKSNGAGTAEHGQHVDRQSMPQQRPEWALSLSALTPGSGRGQLPRTGAGSGPRSSVNAA
jgi:parallel beta-helix repeat protein